METVTIQAGSIDDISPVDHRSIEVTLSEVNLKDLISEIGVEEILDEMDLTEIREYIEEKERKETEEHA